ncbi:MAG: MotA/TolQ/ExbB proton channel family protein [Campylobacterota bacterium]
MQLLDTFLNYYDKSSAITIFVLGLLSIYLIAILWIFLYRYIEVSSWYSQEFGALEKLDMSGGSGKGKSSPIISNFLQKYDTINAKAMESLKMIVEKKVTRGLTFLSIVASTSPFIGLFGTVVSILETFAALGTANSATLTTVAPAISEALVATAAGIFVATFAYSFHLMLKRKAYDLMNILSRQIDLLLSENNDGDV